MIRFLFDTTQGGVRYLQGSLVKLPADIELALVNEGDAEDFPVITRPIEILGGSAVAVACTQTAVDEVLATVTIAPLGVNSILQIEPLWTFASSGNIKLCKVKIGAITVYTSSRTTSVKESPLIVLANRNSLASQIAPYDGSYAQAGAGAPATYTINFGVAQTIQITGNRAAAEALTLEYFRILHFIGA